MLNAEGLDRGDGMAIVGIVEDDADQCIWLKEVIEHAGHRAEINTSASDFRRRLATRSIDALILDWMLPDQSGIELVRWLRGSVHGALPVLILTAKDKDADTVAALDAGADDYLSKPPNAAVLIARLRALLRRTGIESSADHMIDVGPFALDLRARKVRLNGNPIPVTDREFDLAAYLFRRVDLMVSRDSILREVWRMSPDVPSRSVDTYISRLRRKMGLDGRHGWQLKTIYLHGYRLEAVQALCAIA